MVCPNISNLQLDREDELALEEIRRLRQAGNTLQIALSSGVLATIFLGSHAPEAVYNIYSTDWVLFATAITAVPELVRYRIRQIAKFQQLRPGLTDQQRQFWKAIDYGCGD